MTSPRGIRRNIYPYDASDPNLKWCETCDYPYMPAGGCDLHTGRCLTCCVKEQADCGLRALTPPLKRLTESTEALGAAFADVIKDAEALDAARRRVQAEIDSLYGPPGGQR